MRWCEAVDQEIAAYIIVPQYGLAGGIGRSGMQHLPVLNIVPTIFNAGPDSACPRSASPHLSRNERVRDHNMARHAHSFERQTSHPTCRQDRGRVR